MTLDSAPPTCLDVLHDDFVKLQATRTVGERYRRASSGRFGNVYLCCCCDNSTSTTECIQPYVVQMQDSTLYIMGGTTKSDIPGFVDVRRIPEEGNENENSNAVVYQEDQDQQQQPQFRSKFDDRPPRAWLPRVFWILRHFFALPSVSQQSVEVREVEWLSSTNTYITSVFLQQ